MVAMVVLNGRAAEPAIGPNLTSVTRRSPPQCTIAEAAPHHELTLVHSVPPNVPLALA